MGPMKKTVLFFFVCIFPAFSRADDPLLLTRLMQQANLPLGADDAPIQITGFTNGNFTASTNTHTGSNLPMGMNYLSNNFNLEQNTLIIQSPLDTSRERFQLGFRTYTILPGSDYQFTLSNNLMNGQLTGNDGSPNTYGFDPTEFHLLAWTPALKTQWKVGRFFTIICNESVDPTQNRLVSRAMTFMNNPFTHTGVLATTSLDDNWSVSNGVVQGADVFFGPAAQANYLGGITWISNEQDRSIAFNTMLGSAEYDKRLQTQNQFDVFEILLNRDWSESFHQTLDLLYSFENGIDGITVTRDNQRYLAPGGFSNWYGAIHYLTKDFGEKLSVTNRLELFDDPQGVRTGFAGLYFTLSQGFVWKFRDGLWLRNEARYDYHSSNACYGAVVDSTTNQAMGGEHGLFTYSIDFILRW